MGQDLFYKLSDLAEHLRACSAVEDNEIVLDVEVLHHIKHAIDGALRFEMALREQRPDSKVADELRVQALLLAQHLREAEIAGTLRSITEIELGNNLRQGYLALKLACRTALGDWNPFLVAWFDEASG